MSVSTWMVYSAVSVAVLSACETIATKLKLRHGGRKLSTTTEYHESCMPGALMDYTAWLQAPFPCTTYALIRHSVKQIVRTVMNRLKDPGCRPEPHFRH